MSPRNEQAPPEDQTADALRESLYRDVNEQVARLARTLNISDRILILCECGAPGCSERIEIAPADYARVRRARGARAVAPGHAGSDGGTSKRYVVIPANGRRP